MKALPALMLTSLLLAGAAGAAGAASWETRGFRTRGGDLVEPGASMAEVLKRAGTPKDKHVLSQGLSLDGKPGVTREVWTYRGNDGDYSLTFAGDRLEKIEVVPDR
jgi:hypothetical protein